MKERLVIVVDVGRAMNDGQRDSHLTRAMAALQVVLQQRVVYEYTTSEVGLLVYGADEAQGGTMVLRRVQRGDLEFIRGLAQLDTHEPHQARAGDTGDAITRAVEMLVKCKKQANTQNKIIVVTSLEGSISQVDEQELKEHDIELMVVAMEPASTKEQRNNQAILDGLLSSLGQAGVQDESRLGRLAKEKRKKNVADRCKARIPLMIGDQTVIPCALYTKTLEQKPPALKKYSKEEPFSRSIDDNKVQFSRTYFRQDDPLQSALDPNDLVRGYQYGEQVVPVTKELENEMTKVQTQKGLECLCFVDRDSLGRHLFMGGTDLVVSIDELAARQALQSIVQAMHSMHKVMLVRYVPRDNAPPRLAVLMPQYNELITCLYLVQLPTQEDLRDFQFPSLQESTEEQRTAVEQMVNAMQLDTNMANPALTYNPVLSHIYQSIAQRGMETDTIVEPGQQLVQDMENTEYAMWNRASKQIDEAKQEFKLTQRNIKQQEKKRKIFWKELIAQQEKQQGEDMQAAGEKKGNKDDEAPRHVNKEKPEDDFWKMVKYKKEDLTDSAVEQMKRVIVELLEDSYEGQFYGKAVDCLGALRKGCVQEDEGQVYNEYMEELKCLAMAHHTGYWQMVVDRGLGLVSREETRSSGLSVEQAAAFLGGQVAQAQPVQSDEDYLDDIE